MDAGVAIHQALTALLLAERELLFFATFWFLAGAVDDLAVDLYWLRLWLTGRARDRRIGREEARAPLRGKIAVFIAAWQEADVIGHTIAHAFAAWPQREFTLFVGCYANDPQTLHSAVVAAGNDPRLRIVIHKRAGPTTKADCLNRLYAAMEHDESRAGKRFRTVVLHDSEDMVHPAALALIDTAIMEVGLVQLPVRPEPQPHSPWVGGHYCDEFTEAHAKTMVVRDALGAGIPSAGVGCGVRRDLLASLADRRRDKGDGEGGPFSSASLTEDYELGLTLCRGGASARFLRARDAEGALVATRAYFPASVDASVRQKARWIHGIAFQGWERLGWGTSAADIWMALRDRRGPLSALVLATGYALIVVEGILALFALAGTQLAPQPSPVLQTMLSLCVLGFVWRAAFRFGFTTREYGWVEGLRSILRIIVANVIAIIAARRAVYAYVRTLLGGTLRWDKTLHGAHPASQRNPRALPSTSGSGPGSGLAVRSSELAPL